jgi:peroxiredoxin
MNCKILFTLVTLFVSSTIFSKDPMFDVCPLKVGEKVPEGITVTDDKGKAIVLDQFLKEKPTVLIFFRGGWCGYCSKHLADIQDAKKDIEN